MINQISDDKQTMVNLSDILKDEGCIVIDNFLPESEFQKLNAKVQHSWTTKDSWYTRVKARGKFKLIPYQKGNKVFAIRKELDKVRSRYPDSFTYLYHALHESNDQHGLVDNIKKTIINNFASQPLNDIAHISTDSSFSLTAFTSGCYLDFHTDCPSENVPYLLTVILYFGLGRPNKESGLTFRYRNKESTIDCTPNRCVIFIPTDETIHGVAVNKYLHLKDDIPRLAFSGWLLK
jgi:hypothetical protein